MMMMIIHDLVASRVIWRLILLWF